MTTDPKAAPASVADERSRAIEAALRIAVREGPHINCRSDLTDDACDCDCWLRGAQSALAAAPLPPAASDERAAFVKLLDRFGNRCYAAGKSRNAPDAGPAMNAVLAAYDAARAQPVAAYAQTGVDPQSLLDEAYVAGRNDAVASVEAQGAVYQTKLVSGTDRWVDCTEEFYRNVRHRTDIVTRVLYAAPAAQPPATGAASSDLLEYYWQLKRTEIIEAVERAGFRIVSRIGSVNLEPIAAAPTIATPPEADGGLLACVTCGQSIEGATPPEVAPTDDARAAELAAYEAHGYAAGVANGRDLGWRNAIEAAAKAVNKLNSPYPEHSYNDGVEDSLAVIRDLIASPAADTEGEA